MSEIQNKAKKEQSAGSNLILNSEFPPKVAFDQNFKMEAAQSKLEAQFRFFLRCEKASERRQNTLLMG